MNPVLLKSGGRRSSDGAYLCSIFVLGKQIAIEDYGSLGKRSETLLESVVIPSIHHLQKKTNADIIVMEGAGSCTEMNLMKRDIVNLPLVRKVRIRLVSLNFFILMNNIIHSKRYSTTFIVLFMVTCECIKK